MHEPDAPPRQPVHDPEAAPGQAGVHAENSHAGIVAPVRAAAEGATPGAALLTAARPEGAT
ncbi:hypothetical protein CPE01_05100 [Cellulomonas persica]|uniref:Uncharacterized protein n=1 Tax=Cellulomonas persica TaxID=76861 RepID=A0A510UQ28_9CELL|nr:hypothetical protein CPE01_05100 [Cellulomonas persica]